MGYINYNDDSPCLGGWGGTHTQKWKTKDGITDNWVGRVQLKPVCPLGNLKLAWEYSSIMWDRSSRGKPTPSLTD